MNYKVVNRERHYYIEGLAFSFAGENEPDTMLLYRYPDGDVDSPNDKDKMHSCLYDEYQCNESLKEGDTFDTPFGKFVCVGVHVQPLDDDREEYALLGKPLKEG